MEKTSDKVLALLMNENTYLSGETIGEKLGVSRIAVNKQIKKIVEDGVQIDVCRKGYKLVSSDILTNISLENKFLSNDIDLKVFVNEVESTNNEAKKLYNDFNDNFLYVAPRQLKGRGRLQRQFESNYGGVYMTLCYKPKNLDITHSLKIVLLTGLAVAKTLQKYMQNVSIKWPNDVFVDDKKICGILLESVVSENMTEAIFLGIGINVNNDLGVELENIATSLKLQGVTGVTREQIIVETITTLIDMLEKYQNNGFDTFLEEYTKLSRTINHNVTVNINGEKKSGFALGLSEEGYLMLKTENGVEKIILGDIEV